ncbi:MAG: Spx/MgsR family RNA polymerase-binding regulatory protein [Spirochaetales bacterium]|nr:Spx/MgsR family RNA polymerase-binding regulatory protein [Leptospiraceae bacterium]MCP5480167.1 Spx/MgsR family RNA polymerase-binding regulatory protein [Spirochaetales bacterium]MCP5485493.1 Spx/MgsR family RNA polymerase-binding regulatory protein [Spirochaetales bacterium]
MLEFYGYAKCDTCRRAKRALDEAGIAYREIDITVDPPRFAELQAWRKGELIELKQLLNTNGVDYRRLKMSEKVQKLPEQEVLKLLAHNGRLLKRPIITDGKRVTVGFKNPGAILAAWIER